MLIIQHFHFLGGYMVHNIDLLKNTLKSAIGQLMTTCARKSDFNVLVHDLDL